MNTLHITTKRKWFEMERDGIKLEEYREITPYWVKRLMMDVEVKDPTISYEKLIELMLIGSDDVSYGFIPFDVVSNTNGYGHHRPNIQWEHKGTRIGEGWEEWGAVPGKQYFILSIGEIIKNTNSG